MITQPRSGTPWIHPKPNKLFNLAKAMLVETGATNVPVASSRALRSVIVGIKCAGTALHVLSALLEGVRGRGQLSGVNILMTNKHARVDILPLRIGENMSLNQLGRTEKEGGVVIVGLGQMAKVADTTVDEWSLVLGQQGWVDPSNCAREVRLPAYGNKAFWLVQNVISDW